MSSAFDTIAREIGHIHGSTATFVSNFHSVSADDFAGIAAALVLIYLTYWLFKRTFGLIVFTFKALFYVSLVFLAFRAYTIGVEASIAAVLSFGVTAYSLTVFSLLQTKAVGKYVGERIIEKLHEATN